MTDPTFTSETPFQPNASQEHACLNQTLRDSEYFKFMAYTITYSVVFPIGFISNVLALVVFLRFTPKKTASTVFMTNLAISDASFSLTLPFRLVYYFRGSHWDFPDWFCRWCVFSFYVNLYTSVLFLTGLSVLRYLAVLHPMRHRKQATVWRASLSCFAIWIFVAFLSTPFLMSGTLERDGKIICFEPRNIMSWKRIFILNYVGVSLGFVIPFITILICYSCIFHKLIFGQKNIRKQKQISCRRTVCLIVVVLSTFLLCFLPYHVIRTVHLHAVVSGQDCQVRKYLLKVLVLSLCMAASNSCFNPMLYFFAGKNFRKQVHKASVQIKKNSINHGDFSSLQRRTQSETCQKTRCQRFTPVRQDCLPCSSDNSCQVISKKKPDGCVPEKQCKLSDSAKKQQMTDKGKSKMICSSKEQRKKSECEE
ncbi:cysteinyl leukotriene receptor 2 [Rhinichthys klamathensis goyatoka]|uniref:cysteinyl leukotriene receptor 2 n=1 Tax=Rhinichthys klamathensis goyatoka TaxID=3034132 RepID=UPI0024B4A8F4|nr:cysteinyl leukotriene receptor 2 [Rhinichthys klamathensis goyatoka]